MIRTVGSVILTVQCLPAVDLAGANPRAALESGTWLGWVLLERLAARGWGSSRLKESLVVVSSRWVPRAGLDQQIIDWKADASLQSALVWGESQVQLVWLWVRLSSARWGSGTLNSCPGHASPAGTRTGCEHPWVLHSLCSAGVCPWQGPGTEFPLLWARASVSWVGGENSTPLIIN